MNMTTRSTKGKQVLRLQVDKTHVSEKEVGEGRQGKSHPFDARYMQKRRRDNQL
jgi:hypothetical protein